MGQVGSDSWGFLERRFEEHKKSYWKTFATLDGGTNKLGMLAKKREREREKERESSFKTGCGEAWEWSSQPSCSYHSSHWFDRTSAKSWSRDETNLLWWCQRQKPQLPIKWQSWRLVGSADASLSGCVGYSILGLVCQVTKTFWCLGQARAGFRSQTFLVAFWNQVAQQHSLYQQLCHRRGLSRDLQALAFHRPSEEISGNYVIRRISALLVCRIWTDRQLVASLGGYCVLLLPTGEMFDKTIEFKQMSIVTQFASQEVSYDSPFKNSSMRSSVSIVNKD